MGTRLERRNINVRACTTELPDKYFCREIKKNLTSTYPVRALYVKFFRAVSLECRKLFFVLLWFGSDHFKSSAIQYSISRIENSTFTRNFEKTFFLDLENCNVMVT